jgi:hypothetical protein
MDSHCGIIMDTYNQKYFMMGSLADILVKLSQLNSFDEVKYFLLFFFY